MTLPGTLSVAVIDDSQVQRQHAVNVCRQLGIAEVSDYGDARQALAWMSQNTGVDLAVVDLEMPIMDGIELIRELAAQKLAGSVIILSAKDPALIACVGTMAEADGLRVMGTIPKPLTPELLTRCLLRSQDALQEEHGEAQAPWLNAERLNAGLEQGEFLLHYQPQVTAKTRLLKGVEALARWQHPEHGLISPVRFIPIAERHGLMDKLTRVLLTEALRQKQDWQAHGLKLQMAFNLSPLSLADHHLSDWIADMSRFAGIEPRSLTLEVTENALLDDLAGSIRTLARLRLKGFNVAIDDYGTGYANAMQLSRVPATELKLDRCLVHNVISNPHQETILGNTLELARQLKMLSIVEGVENQEEFELLSRLGADLIQGYYIARPMPGEELPRWLQKQLRPA